MKKRNRRRIVAAVALVATVLAVIVTFSEKSPVAVAKYGVERTVDITVDALYVVDGSTVVKHGQFEGAGAFISPTGHILTCAHLFTNGYVLRVEAQRSNGQKYPAEVIFMDRYADLALLKVVGHDFPYLTLGKLDAVKVGQRVVAIGSPFGFAFSVSHGVVSALDRYELNATNMIQTDASSNHGNSGGPLLNMKGELIGVNTRGTSMADQSCGVNFAESIREIRKFLGRFKGLEAGM